MPNTAQRLAPDTAPIRSVGQADDADVADVAAPELHADEGHPSRADVEREAYLIYVANGYQDGNAEDDWYTAERRLSNSQPARQTDATQEQAAAQLEEANATVRTPG